MDKINKAFWLVSLLFLAACSTGRENNIERVSVPSHWHFARQDIRPSSSSHQLLTPYYAQLNDSNLSWLIGQALQNNPDIQQALNRIAAARAEQKASSSQLFPNLSLSANYQRVKQPFYQPPIIFNNTYDVSFDASYEIDLFGKLKSAKESKEFASLAADKESEWARLSLVAEITRTYINVVYLNKKLEISKNNLLSEQQTLALVKQQYQAGYVSELEVKRVALQIEQLNTELSEFMRQLHNTELSLIPLTGVAYEQIHQLTSNPHFSHIIHEDNILRSPASMLANRPDIMAANLHLQEATALKAAQAAAIFPAINIGGLFGLSKTALAGPISVWNIGPNAVMSLLDFGRIEAEIDLAKVNQAEAYQRWRKTILLSMQEVETALNNVAQFRLINQSLHTARSQAKQAVLLAKARYKAGESSLIDVLELERQYNSIEMQLANVECNYTTAVVALYKALGQ